MRVSFRVYQVWCIHADGMSFVGISILNCTCTNHPASHTKFIKCNVICSKVTNRSKQQNVPAAPTTKTDLKSLQIIMLTDILYVTLWCVRSLLLLKTVNCIRSLLALNIFLYETILCAAINVKYKKQLLQIKSPN